MDASFIIPLLGLGTLLAVCILAMVGKASIERRRNDPSAPKSSLASDGPTGNPVAYDE